MNPIEQLHDWADLIKQFEVLPKLPDDFDPVAEVNHVAKLAQNQAKSVFKHYSGLRAEGAGGSGVVISGLFVPHLPQNTRRAIKLPRLRLYSAPLEDQPPAVDQEIHALSKVSHQNITRLYQSIALTGGWGHCSVTEYVESAQSLDEFAVSTCCSDLCRNNQAQREIALIELAAKVYAVVDALHYMHTTETLLHCDVKPDNILVSRNGKPFVTDLGFARDTSRYEKDEAVEVGFTWKYAHKRLTNPHKGARVSKTPAKSKNTIPASELTPIIDVFAFGRTLQEVLKHLENEYREAIYSSYSYNYLHFVAALCLDGTNVLSDHRDNQDFVSDQAFGLPVELFEQSKFSSFAPALVALERLLGWRRFEDDVEELDQWASNTIRVSDLGVTTFSDRVGSIIAHPVMQRLAGELQLGMLDTVFPTASHTRFQHSLGVYHAVCEYIRALYYDPENPTFRILIDEKHCRKVLLAALMHDIGQTMFGHEMEEVDEAQFSHVQIGALLLKESQEVDEKNQTLRDLITGDATDNWDLTIEELGQFMNGPPQTPLDGVLHDILDGQLDADKLDYLMRDAVETRVAYGHGIDFDRFLRSLTTGSPPNDESPYLRLAIKRKGAAAAEAFAFARYQMYQALYWHHTFRAVKSNAPASRRKCRRL